MRRACTLLLSVVLGTAMVACADAPSTDVRTVTIRPRIVVDGTLELADRTGGRIVLEGMVAHADEARVTAENDALVVDDRVPLFFSFAPDGVSEQLASEREWSVPVNGGTITMRFGPAASTDIDNAPFSVEGLDGHTALIRGTIAISLDGFSAFSEAGEIDPDGSPAIPEGDPTVSEIDPDGSPAIPEGDPTVSEIDPDGSPAVPEGDPTVSEIDPDGSPAVPEGDPTVSEIDPDGSPAVPDAPSKGEVDPDGSPAKPIKGEVDPDGSPAKNAIVAALKQRQKMSGSSARGQVIVPFTLVVDGAFEHTTTLTAAEIATVGADEVLPLDLRIAATDIFTAARLSSLETLAQAAVAAGLESQGLAVSVSAMTTARALDVKVHAAVAAVPDVALDEVPQINHRMIVGSIR